MCIAWNLNQKRMDQDSSGASGIGRIRNDGRLGQVYVSTTATLRVALNKLPQFAICLLPCIPIDYSQS